MSTQLLMWLMLPWFVGHFGCLIGDGVWIGTAERTLVNIVGAFTAPTVGGIWSIMTSTQELFPGFLARIFLWDYSFFGGEYAIFRWLLLFILTIPFVIGFILTLVQVAQGVFSNR